ncbi:MAG: hypothetical protein EOO70_05820 [Myxococcaceae bacterium]|nr:MAG: hypothetical protein EOO70_05820 [Myxococcaceae bacterium]
MVRKVDVRRLVARAGPYVDCRMPVQWSDGSGVMVRLTRRQDEGQLALTWLLAGQPLTFSARLETTAQKLGGRRWWVRCPRCERRCAVLVLTVAGDGVGCRVCLRLPYQSQLTGRPMRQLPLDGAPDGHALRMVQRIRRKYGAPESVMVPFTRPKGMHRRTWDEVSTTEMLWRQRALSQTSQWLGRLQVYTAEVSRTASRAPARARPKLCGKLG